MAGRSLSRPVGSNRLLVDRSPVQVLAGATRKAAKAMRSESAAKHYFRCFRPLLFDRDPRRGAGAAFFERRLYLRGHGAIDLGVLAIGIDSRDWAP